MRSGLNAGMLVPAALALVLVVAIAVIARNGSDGNVGGIVPTASPTASPTVVVSPSATASPRATPSATARPTPTPKPTRTPRPTPTPSPVPVATVGPCEGATLAARITMWEGAAGSRIATVELTNGGPKCKLQTMARPQLVDAAGTVLIDGSDPTTSNTLTINAGEKVSTLVQDSNYCGSAPTAPVTVRFVMTPGGKVQAAPLSPTDATVPPCNGPGSPSHIEMHPWAR